jgi:hypothetical protein
MKEPGTGAHVCNPSYSGSRVQEDWVQSQLGKQFKRPYLKNTLHKNGAGGVAQSEGPEYCKKKKKNMKELKINKSPLDYL